jgi:hypothetical protein
MKAWKAPKAVIKTGIPARVNNQFQRLGCVRDRDHYRDDSGLLAFELHTSVLHFLKSGRRPLGSQN